MQKRWFLGSLDGRCVDERLVEFANSSNLVAGELQVVSLEKTGIGFTLIFLYFSDQRLQ